jgi:uncharacterized membrane protein
LVAEVRKGLADEDGSEDEGVAVSSRLFRPLILGIALVLIGVAVLVVAGFFYNSSSTSVGVVVFVGPFPIVFGSGPNASWLIIMGVVLAALSLVLVLVMYRRRELF